MFSKSKRFPKVDKDYIPGPGEYEVIVDDSSPYKRHGFISQTSRFSDILELPNDFLKSNTTYKSDSNSSLSISSTESSIKSLSDDSVTRSLTNPTSPDTPIISNIKNVTQREIETLQQKTRKMELQIQALENERNDNKSIIIGKDLELADLRSKNTTLQKTINRQEIASKVTRLQKKNELLDQQLETSQKQLQISLQENNEKDIMIHSLTEQLTKNAVIIDEFQKQHKQHVQKQESMDTVIHELTAKLAASEYNAGQKDMQINVQRKDIQCIQDNYSKLSLEKEHLENHVVDLKQEILRLQSRVLLKDEEIDILLNKMDDKETEMKEQSTKIQQLQDMFNTYRDYIENTVMTYLHNQKQNEYNRILTELYEAKKFINKQAQQLDGLKSDVHWLTVQNSQLTKIAIDMTKEQTTLTQRVKRVVAAKKPISVDNDNCKPLKFLLR